ncbi:MAG: L-2-amino-thiazoline-4-carboxylic acid hydrolase [Oscillospiraceae bacterium]|nr:L-2-amino-thiazoline-4-carboxylic acid hydrolase [Oscillospiraceae bacterium]
MHRYYERKQPKLKKNMDRQLRHIRGELERDTGKSYPVIFEEIWNCYVADFLERFPYIGGDDVSGTSNLTGAYCYVAMGEVLKKYGQELEHIGRLMTLSYERMYRAMPGAARWVMGKLFNSPGLLTRMFRKKDAANAANAAKYPGSFETKVQAPTAEYPFIYHNLVCPLSNFAMRYGYGEYMPYLCNLDYVMFGVLGVPLYRSHTCFLDGDYCDFSIKPGAPVMEYWPPVCSQKRGFK